MQAEHNDPINTTVGELRHPVTGEVWRPTAIEHAYPRALEQIMQNREYGYQTQAGNPRFLQSLAKFVLREDLYEAMQDRMVAVQAAGGTGALRLAGSVLHKFIDAGDEAQPSLILDDGWANHRNVFGSDFSIRTYEHLKPEIRYYNHQEYMKLLEESPDSSAVLVQASGYNDDGVDRRPEQWDEVLEMVSSRDFPLIIDAAYVGLANGIAEDSYVLRQSAAKGILTLACVSASKNMGLYGERIGALYILNAAKRVSVEQQARLQQAAQREVRGTSSSQPRLGALAVALVLDSEAYTYEYVTELESMRQKLVARREALSDELYVGRADFSHIWSGRGLFTRLVQAGFTADQRTYLKTQGILALPNSRLNIGGIKAEHIPRVGQAVNHALSLVE